MVATAVGRLAPDFHLGTFYSIAIAIHEGQELGILERNRRRPPAADFMTFQRFSRRIKRLLWSSEWVNVGRKKRKQEEGEEEEDEKSWTR